MTALPPATPTPERGIGKPRSLLHLAMARFRRNKPALFGCVILALVFASTFGIIPFAIHQSAWPSNPALLLPPRYDLQQLDQIRRPPNADHPFGTDGLGRDLLARYALGGSISLVIGLAAAAIAVVIGTTAGMIAGYSRPQVDAVLMRTVDILYGLPTILIVILLRVILVEPITQAITHAQSAPPGTGQWTLDTFLRHLDTRWISAAVMLIAIGVVSWLTMARVIRGQVLSLKAQPFMEACRALGLSHARILLVHVLPNLAGTIVVYATLTVPTAILTESLLSFLNLGIQAPLPSWGNLASEGVASITPYNSHWWLVLWPCLGLSVSLLALNFVGDGLRDALDPKSR